MMVSQARCVMVIIQKLSDHTMRIVVSMPHDAPWFYEDKIDSVICD